jgi:hypothetical protein
MVFTKPNSIIRIAGLDDTGLVTFQTMKLRLKAIGIILMLLAFVAPLAPGSHCESDHESEGKTECACVCHSAPDWSLLEPAINVQTFKSERTDSVDTLYLKRLSIAEVFRPPIAA